MACATGTGTTDDARVLQLAPEVREYLIDPTQGMEDIPGGSRGQALQVFERLRAGDLEAARQGLSALAGVDSEVRQVLEAQLAFAGERTDEARQILGPEPSSDAAILLLGRLHELSADPVAALGAYWRLRDRLAVADERARALVPQAIAQRDLDFDRAIANRNLDAAGVALEDLRAWSTDRPQTRRSAVRLAQAAGDERAELAAWRSLAQLAPPSRDEMFRWAGLEISNGSADQALEISRALVASAENDPQARELLARAEFVWRSRLLPEKARTVLASPVLTRAELAVALYWLFPQARYAPSRAVRIASDILESPHREEIAQIVNAGLLDVDSAGHRFRPEMAADRADAASCVAELLRTGGAGCAIEVSDARACSVLAACAVAATESCSSAREISGAEFSDWARRAQDRLTRP